MEKHITKIVLTGGPAAGKTTLISRILKEFKQEDGWRVITIPETATELISGFGIKPFGGCMSMLKFQDFVIADQIHKEELALKAAEVVPEENVLIIYDRALMDDKAYISDEEFAETLYRFGGRTEERVLKGYDAVLHLVTCAKGAEFAYNFGNAVFSAAGNTKKPLVYLLVAGVINVLLNLLFVIVCGLGVAGVAIASAVSQYVSAILIISALLRTDESYRLRFSKLRLYRDKSRSVLSLGVPAGLQNSIFAIANLFIQSGVNSFDAVIVEGNSAAANADSLVYDVMAAFYIACSSFMGQNYGAGKRDRVLKSYGVCLFYSFAIGAILGLSVVFFGESFLSVFSSDREVIEAGIRTMEHYGTGCSGSRFLNGTLQLHLELEEALAKFLRKEEVITFGTGFQSNVGIISALVGRHDYVICDRENHASIYAGCQMSYGKMLRYRHSDMEDLEKQLQRVPEQNGALIVTDGVFSMGGDIAKLPEICALAKKYGARVMVDDAHG